MGAFDERLTSASDCLNIPELELESYARLVNSKLVLWNVSQLKIQHQVPGYTLCNLPWIQGDATKEGN